MQRITLERQQVWICLVAFGLAWALAVVVVLLAAGCWLLARWIMVVVADRFGCTGAGNLDTGWRIAQRKPSRPISPKKTAHTHDRPNPQALH